MVIIQSRQGWASARELGPKERLAKSQTERDVKGRPEKLALYKLVFSFFVSFKAVSLSVSQAGFQPISLLTHPLTFWGC